MSEKISILSLLAVLALVFSGCTSVATFDYTQAQGTLAVFQERGTGTKTITVLPFLDQRGTKYFDPMQAGQAAAHPASWRA